MSKIAVVFWSGTGNTESMANEVASVGAEVISASSFTSDSVDSYDAIAFGCPASGAEDLEESEFQPMWESVKSNLNGKKVALFGSYGWGGGPWMETWKEECESLGIAVVDVVICEGEPDDDVKQSCRDLGAKLQ